MSKIYKAVKASERLPGHNQLQHLLVYIGGKNPVKKGGYLNSFDDFITDSGSYSKEEVEWLEEQPDGLSESPSPIPSDIQESASGNYIEQEKCSHEWVGYKQCCYCGAYESYDGRIIEKRTQSNVEELRTKFSEWYFGVKETNGGNPPLAMQIFFWFDQNLGIFTSLNNLRLKEKDDECELWHDVAGKCKQQIESLTAQLKEKEQECEKWKATAGKMISKLYNQRTKN